MSAHEDVVTEPRTVAESPDLYWIRYETPADPDGCWRAETGYLQKFGPDSPRATFTRAQAEEKAAKYQASSYTKSKYFVEPVSPPHEHEWTRTSDDLLFCFGCKTELYEPVEK